MLMPHVVHDEAARQRQGQFRERRHPGMRRCRHQRGNLRGAVRRGSRLLRWARRLPGAVRAAQQAFPGAAVEHRFDVLPGVHHLVRRIARQLHVPAPRVEVGRVRLHVLVRRVDAVRMEDELVRREEQAAVRALDALGARAVVTCGQESAAAAPGALVMDGERKVFGQSGMVGSGFLCKNLYSRLASRKGHRFVGPKSKFYVRLLMRIFFFLFAYYN